MVSVTAVANFGLGFCMVAANTTSATITQHLVSDEMRGRVMGLFPLMMGLSMLTAAPVGGMGQLVGLEAIVPTLGWITLALCTAVVLTRPQLRRVDGTHHETAPANIVLAAAVRSGGAREPAERPGGTLHGGIDGDPGGGEVATDLVDELALPGDIVLRRTEDYGDWKRTGSDDLGEAIARVPQAFGCIGTPEEPVLPNVGDAQVMAPTFEHEPEQAVRGKPRAGEDRADRRDYRPSQRAAAPSPAPPRADLCG